MTSKVVKATIAWYIVFMVQERMASYTIRDVDPEVRRAFKVWCLRERLSMNEAFLRFMAEKAREVGAQGWTVAGEGPAGCGGDK